MNEEPAEFIVMASYQCPDGETYLEHAYVEKDLVAQTVARLLRRKEDGSELTFVNVLPRDAIKHRLSLVI
jgi:hypothetical protein